LHPIEHLVRCAGWYSNRSRGKRRRAEPKPPEFTAREIDVREATRVIALIDEKAVIRKILSYLGLRVP
jgi:hypothetical protein